MGIARNKDDLNCYAAPHGAWAVAQSHLIF